MFIRVHKLHRLNIVVCYRHWHTTAGENVWLGWMNSNTADVVRVGFKHVDPLQGIVIEHTNLHVILKRKRINDGQSLIVFSMSKQQPQCDNATHILQNINTFHLISCKITGSF